MNLIDLRATLAMRAEDTRIARKHRDEAAARTMSAENRRALDGASEWLETCLEAERVARSECIRALGASYGDTGRR